MSAGEEALLDNPVYESLRGPHARFAEIQGNVRRYQADVAPFLGLPASPSAADWRDAAALLHAGAFAAVQLGEGELPSGWKPVNSFDLVQMVGANVLGAAYPEALALGRADVPEMLELVAETVPGPFLERTIELGDYLGIRREGRLVAMAGERFRVDGWTEVSAVCTRPDARGEGLASRLLGELIRRIQGRSERVFLHCMASNVAAIRLYETLGFVVRTVATMSVVIHDS
jgi:ribosomal protein S18 acetylase RimI-like enzyme